MTELEQILDNVIDEVPMGVAKAVLVLVSGIVKIVRAGDDPDAQLDAMMTTAESLKAQIDDAKFGPATKPMG